MKGDFSRDTFNSRKNFSRVLMQQGRVQLDADFNEQSAILLHYLRTLTIDLIGQHGGPGSSFEINFIKDGKDLTIAPGHYYVDGILCENDEKLNHNPVSYLNQPSYRPNSNSLPDFPFLIYLDVWERHITCFEDESLCEVALGGIDTTTRTQVVWQVKLLKLEGYENQECGSLLPPQSDAKLSARTRKAEVSDDPCNIEPDARYRGAENQLYRVEIHTGNADNSSSEQPPITFKWSRENGSVVFTVMSLTSSNDMTEVGLANLGRDDKFGLREGDWVELIDDAYTLHNRAGNLMRIASIDRDEMSVTLNGAPKFPISVKPENHPLLRRWDQKAGIPQEGGLTLNTEGSNADNAAIIIKNNWLNLEDGIQIKFTDENSTYRTGDYWLIPARTATGDVEWEKDASGAPVPQPPHGIEHHYAPLGIAVDANTLTPCRCTLKPVSIFLSAKGNVPRKGKNP
ncbi:MAG TPA: DUF6519 domain-containing protein [Pyrinomonadaceae bacterium]|nr:DUF6519 domain-containing protein [Pyrinomonadaceae bacterium]